MRSSTRLVTLEGWPIQIGVANTRMFASSTCLRRAGQASPSPSSVFTPGLTSWSTTRTNDVSTSCDCNSCSN